MKISAKKLFSAVLAASVLMLASCGEQGRDTGSESWGESIVYSNLVDAESRDELREALEGAGVSPSSTDILMESIDKYNSAVGSILPVKSGFEPLPEYFSAAYDSNKLERKWRRAYGKSGRKNCRLTAYEAMGSLIGFGDGAAPEPLLVVERDDPSVFRSQEDMDKFTILFNGLGSNDDPETLSAAEQAKRLTDYWEQAGVRFPENGDISMFSILNNSHLTVGAESYTLHCGHVGVLIRTENSGVLLFEKLAFEFPYQLIKFPNEEAALDYIVRANLMGSEERTIVLINDKLVRREGGHFVC